MHKSCPIIGIILFSLNVTVLTGHAQEPERPQRVPTSTGIYDVQSADEIHKFSANEIRKLVQMENGRNQGEGTVPHPVLVYCFEEKTFQYNGGKYQNAEIKYRLHTPKNIRYGRTYPLIVHLHGMGEAGSNNTSSLVHLHSILPVLIGPEREDFFMLVTQCPKETPAWHFNRSSKDGTLDVLTAVMEHVIVENPIDIKRITTTGVSSGGWGVWELVLTHPDMFAGAVPTACGVPPQYKKLEALKQTKIWSIVNKGNVSPESIQSAMRVLNNSGGRMALTEANAPGHNAWKPAMEDYQCFRWMLAQKRGSWFSPPPGVIVHNKPRSALLVPFMYILPFAIIVFLLWETICELAASAYQSVKERISDN